MSAGYSGRCGIGRCGRGCWTGFSGNDLAVTKEHTSVASDLDDVQWTPRSGEGSTVVVHHADSTHWYTLEQTESGQLTHAITQHSAHKMM